MIHYFKIDIKLIFFAVYAIVIVKLARSGISSLKDIKISRDIEADCIEIHTGKLANLVKSNKNYYSELKKIKKCVIFANNLNLEVHAGHGLDYKTTKILSKIREIKEFNNGHYIIGESIFFGFKKIIKNFKKIIKK